MLQKHCGKFYASNRFRLDSHQVGRCSFDLHEDIVKSSSQVRRTTGERSSALWETFRRDIQASLLRRRADVYGKLPPTFRNLDAAPPAGHLFLDRILAHRRKTLIKQRNTTL